MEFAEEKIDDVHVLKISGRIDATCVSQLKAAVLAMLGAEKLKILVEMADVDFIDSSGLGTLVACLRAVSLAGGALKIAALQNNPKKLFETTRLNRIFDLYDDRGSAINSF